MEDFSGHLALGKCPLFVCRVSLDRCRAFDHRCFWCRLRQRTLKPHRFSSMKSTSADSGIVYKCLPGQQMIKASLALWSIGRPVTPIWSFGLAGMVAAEAAAADPRMGCVYLTPTPLSTSAPLYLCFQICSRFAARAIVSVEGDPARAQQRSRRCSAPAVQRTKQPSAARP